MRHELPRMLMYDISAQPGPEFQVVGFMLANNASAKSLLYLVSMLHVARQATDRAASGSMMLVGKLKSVESRVWRSYGAIRRM